MPLIIFLLVVAITALSVFAIERGEVQRQAAAMSRTAQAMASAIDRRASTSASYLRAGAALFTTQERVDPELFRQFVAELRLDTDYRGSDGLGWAPVIEADELADFERRIGRGRVDSVAVRPSLAEQPRDVLTPILFLQPDTLRNRRALGFDMYSTPMRRAAMDEATRSMRPTASGKVVLVQEGGEPQPGFLIFMPVFETREGPRSLRGFIYSPFNARQFLKSAADLVEHGNLGIRLYAENELGEPELLSQTGGWSEEGETVTREVRAGNRTMYVSIQAAGDRSLSALSMITLLFGLAVASLLMLVARLLTQQAHEDQRSLDWFAEQNSIRISLTRELNHRVKNTLANVLSIMSLTRRRARDLDEFADGLDGRIRALSATHDLLTKSEWGTTPIRSVVAAELAPYWHDNDHEIEMDGPPVELAPNDALSLGLAIHELATNAAKYGALSVAMGRVSVTWDLTNDRLARIFWVESGGPTVAPPRQRGFGTDLIEKIIAHELRHPVDLDFEPEGVRCTLLVPVREPSEFEIRAKPVARGH